MSRLALLSLAVCTLPSLAMAAPDPVVGKQLFDDTPNVDGVASGITNTCTNCHTNVQDRRQAISGSASVTAYISYEAALNRLGSAVGSIPDMRQFQALSAPQLEDLAAYIADVPTVTIDGMVGPSEVTFASTGVGNAVTKNITVTHATTAPTPLRITAVNLGSTPNGFSAASNCTNVATAPAGTCTFAVTFTPASTTARQVGLTLTMSETGSTTPTTRTVLLKGTVAGAPAPAPAPTPAPAPAPGDDSGGGALGWSWLVGLSLGTAALSTRRRRAR